MTAKDIKEEARHKLALNMHQAIVIYTVEFTIFITLIALIVLACVSFGVNTVASVVIMCYGVLLGLIAVTGAGMLSFAMTDFYLATYRCKPYNIRRLGETLARSNITKILLLSLKRTLLGFLLLLCFIIPGVIYLIRTSMAGYLLIANPKMRASTALTASNKVMSGKTGTYFSLVMSLLGWYLLGVVTLGLGFIFIAPYTHLVKAVYYKRNLQGDKTVYYLQPQPVSPQVQQAQPQQQAYAVTGGGAQQAPQTQPQQQPQPVQGPAPIDTLADEDIMDMNAAMRDFGAEPDKPVTAQDDVPEVPIMPVTVNKKPQKTKETKVKHKTTMQQTAQQQVVQVVDDDAVEHKIDGTGLVETERTLSTHELTESEALRKKVIDNMYSNTGQSASGVNYFDMDAKQTHDGFVDDFGVEPEQSEPIVAAEPEVVVAEPEVIVAEAEPVVVAEAAEKVDPAQQSEQVVMSDSEFDEFLKNFDNMSEPVSTPVQAEPPKRPEAPVAETSASGSHPQSDARTDATRRAAERRREAEERLARDRAAAEERRKARQTELVQHSAARAERIRREREQRLNQNNRSGR